MKPARILIIEDDPMISLDLETIVANHIAADIVVASTIAEAQDVLAAPIDFAFLDIDVLDGKTFPVAIALRSAGTSFAFVSGSNQEDMPAELRDAHFIPKPYSAAEIGRALRHCMGRDAEEGVDYSSSADWGEAPAAQAGTGSFKPI